MKNRSLFVILFVLTAAVAQTQSVYLFEYAPDAANSNLQYQSLLIRQPDGSAMTRIKIKDSLTGKLHLIEMNLMEEYYTTVPGNEASDTLLYRPLDTLVLSEDPDYAFKAPHFWFVAGNTREFVPGWLSNAESPGNADKIIFSVARFIDLKSPENKVLKEFFNRNDPFFVNVLKPGTRGLEPHEKKMKLHYLGIANTNDPIIGPACGMSMRQIDQLFRKLSSAMGIGYQFDSIAGKTYNIETVEAAIKKLSPAKDDIVIIYYMGHGFRKTADERPFPYLDLRRDPSSNNYMKESLASEDIFTRIRKKGARFTLMLTDCCNTDPNVNNIVASPVPTQRESADVWNTDNFRKLFLDPARSAIIVTAADMHQRATSNNNFGGFFSYFFQSSLRKQLGPGVKPDFVTWDVLISDARKQTIAKAERTYCDKPYIKVNICRQYPLYRKKFGND